MFKPSLLKKRSSHRTDDQEIYVFICMINIDKYVATRVQNQDMDRCDCGTLVLDLAALAGSPRPLSAGRSWHNGLRTLALNDGHKTSVTLVDAGNHSSNH